MTDRDYSKDRVQKLSYAKALELVYNGWVIAREGWISNTRGIIVFQATKGTFDAKDLMVGTLGPFLVIRNQIGEYVPYMPSQEDMTANDWAAITRQSFARQVPDANKHVDWTQRLEEKIDP